MGDGELERFWVTAVTTVTPEKQIPLHVRAPVCAYMETISVSAVIVVTGCHPGSHRQP